MKILLTFLAVIFFGSDLLCQDIVHVGYRDKNAVGIVKNVDGIPYLITPFHTFGIQNNSSFNSLESSLVKIGVEKPYILHPYSYQALDISIWRIVDYPSSKNNNWNFENKPHDLTKLTDFTLHYLDEYGNFHKIGLNDRDGFRTNNKDYIILKDTSNEIELGYSGSPLFAKYDKEEVFVGTLSKVDEKSRELEFILTNVIERVFNEFLDENAKINLIDKTNSFSATRSILFPSQKSPENWQLAQVSLSQKISSELGCPNSADVILPEKIDPKSKNTLTILNCGSGYKLPYTVSSIRYSDTQNAYAVSYKLLPISTTKAGLMSLLIPGLGQIYKKEYTKGITLPLIIPAAIIIRNDMLARSNSLKIEGDNIHTDWRNATTSSSRPLQFIDENGYNEYNKMLDSLANLSQSKLSKSNKLYNNRNKPLLFAGVLWGLNVVDALIPYRSEKRHVLYIQDFKMSFKRRLSPTGISLSLELD